MGVELLISDMEAGGKTYEFQNEAAVAHANIYIRMGFLRKVYGILSFQIFLTVLTSAVIYFSNIRFHVVENQWVVIASSLLALGVLLALMVKRKDSPTNYILLVVFTQLEAISIATVTAYYDQIIVLQAFFLTLIITVSLTVYTFQTKRDFSQWKAGLFSGICTLILASWLGIFLGNTQLEVLISVGGSLLFSLFIIFDTHQIIHHVSPEEYILATIELYLDIINLFLNLLRILRHLKE